MVTRDWKRLVKQKIATNKATGRAPRTIKELTRMLKVGDARADPSGIYRMLDGDQPSSKYAPKICEILGIEPAMVVNQRVTDAVGVEEFDLELERIRQLPPAKRKRALTVIRTYLDTLDEE